MDWGGDRCMLPYIMHTVHATQVSGSFGYADLSVFLARFEWVIGVLLGRVRVGKLYLVGLRFGVVMVCDFNWLVMFELLLVCL